MCVHAGGDLISTGTMYLVAEKDKRHMELHRYRVPGTVLSATHQYTGVPVSKADAYEFTKQNRTKLTVGFV